MNILHVKSITLTRILCFRCSFQRFLLKMKSRLHTPISTVVHVVGSIFGAQTTFAWSKSECAALTSSFDRNNSDGKATLKQQKTSDYELFSISFFYATFL